MGKSKEIVSCSSFPKFDTESTIIGTGSHYCNDPGPGVWTAAEGGPYNFPHGRNFQSGYSSIEDDARPVQQNVLPEVNLENVLKGGGADSNVSFLESSKDGDSFLHSSVYAPSAPSLHEAEALKFCDYKEVLLAEPPEWLPDSHSSTCMQHHCRFCGGIFCRACTKGRCLMPVKFRQREPQRVCDNCYDRLEPLQDILIKSMSNAMQTGWLNLPIGLSMEYEIYKASNSLRSYCQVSRLDPEKSIPAAVLRGAKGLAILTVAKFGAVLTYKVGTGLVVARRSNGSWSAPSAILSVGLGWGPQRGIYQPHAFFSWAGLSAAAGPVGRVLEADLRAGDRGSGMCYTYSCSKGAFVGASLEGNMVMTRLETNARFYGDAYLATHDILLGMVEKPRAAEPLYLALDDLFTSL
ncbi:unnamed protein product [Spirodela intermedia]|uniref:FYVE-type domain-containing protein n=1 Tax=Spirodela intermedia TaxID=51605 RepID=A0A7I8ILE0_SPIIN|nr:unnamed protein product [Spirodela intermedia]CAA6658705.1 unnamed protein product [Spirodela intermedia]